MKQSLRFLEPRKTKSGSISTLSSCSKKLSYLFSIYQSVSSRFKCKVVWLESFRLYTSWAVVLSSQSAKRVVSSAQLWLLIFLPQILYLVPIMGGSSTILDCHASLSSLSKFDLDRPKRFICLEGQTNRDRNCLFCLYFYRYFRRLYIIIVIH